MSIHPSFLKIHKKRITWEFKRKSASFINIPVGMFLCYDQHSGQSPPLVSIIVLLAPRSKYHFLAPDLTNWKAEEMASDLPAAEAGASPGWWGLDGGCMLSQKFCALGGGVRWGMLENMLLIKCPAWGIMFNYYSTCDLDSFSVDLDINDDL